MKRILLAAALLFSAQLFVRGPAFATDHLNVVKAGSGIVYAGLDVGIAQGFYKKYDLDVTSIQLPSAAAAFQAVTGGSADMTLQSGTSMGFSLKGVPQTAVATLSGAPYDFVIAVDPNGPIKTLADLKGKRIAVTSTGSITYWFVKQLGLIEGWGPDAVTPQPINGNNALQLAAMARGDVEGIVTTPEAAADAAEHGKARVVLKFGDVFQKFQTHTIFASNKLIAEKPDVVSRFLKGWFSSVRFMVDPAHHAEAVKISADSMQISLSAAEAVYNDEMKSMSLDGAFDADAVDVVRKSLPDSGILDHVPDAKDLYTDKFVPVKLP